MLLLLRGSSEVVQVCEPLCVDLTTSEDSHLSSSLARYRPYDSLVFVFGSSIISVGTPGRKFLRTSSYSEWRVIFPGATGTKGVDDDGGWGLSKVDQERRRSSFELQESGGTTELNGTEGSAGRGRGAMTHKREEENPVQILTPYPLYIRVLDERLCQCQRKPEDQTTRKASFWLFIIT